MTYRKPTTVDRARTVILILDCSQLKRQMSLRRSEP